MSNDFMPSNKTIDDIVQGVTGPEGLTQMREAIKAHLAGMSEQAAPAPRVALPVSQSAPTHYRVIYPHLNDRVTLYGSSEQELDEKERHRREMYGS